MIGRFPLWMIVAVWLAQRGQRLSAFNLARQARLIEDLRLSLPVPATRLEGWLLARVLERIDREKAALADFRLTTAELVERLR